MRQKPRARRRREKKKEERSMEEMHRKKLYRIQSRKAPGPSQ